MERVKGTAVNALAAESSRVLGKNMRDASTWRRFFASLLCFGSSRSDHVIAAAARYHLNSLEPSCNSI